MSKDHTRRMAYGVLAICSLPLLFTLLGVDFGTQSNLDIEALGQMEPAAAREAVLQSVGGSYVHTILEWSATAVALFTVVLAFTHFYIKRDVVTRAVLKQGDRKNVPS